MTDEMTTIKVRKSTRAAISREARRRGTTADEYLAALVAEEIWRERMQRARQDMASADAEYASEVNLWDTATASDGVN